MFIGDTSGVQAIKSDALKKSDTKSLAPTQISLEEQIDMKHISSQAQKKKNKFKSQMPTMLQQKPSCKPTRILKLTFEKQWQINQVINSIVFPLKHVETSEMSRGIIVIYFYSLANAIQMYNTLLRLNVISDLKYLMNLSTFEHCDRVIFNNKFNLTEVNILRFLETLDKVVMLKKLSHRKYFVKFDSVSISENIQRVMAQQFWQFDRRYYESLICFTEINYDFVYITMTNPMRLKFCNLEQRQKYKHLTSQIDFKAIMDEQDNRTTIMIKNIPNRIQKKDLIELINQNFYGGFDFIYLPIDFKVFFIL